MRLDANENFEMAPFFEVLDLNSGEYLKDVVIVDEEEGYYEVYARSDSGYLIRTKQGNLMLQRFYGNIKLVYKGE